MDDLDVEYSAAHPRGLALCDFCNRRVPWPSYKAHVADCFHEPPLSEKSPEPSETPGRGLSVATPRD